MSNKRCLYLKSRPYQLDEVVGQPNVVNTLKKASINDEFAHAYMLSGNHGCGKTTVARILANLMNCTDVKDGRVCGKCRACQTIHVDGSLDVLEIDGATNRGIDDVKKLIEASSWQPQELKRKVYIIDEVHQLSKEAISALLKILEEPPSYLTFILCTTQAKKILPTIMSRCQRFNFNKIPSKIIVERLKNIAKKEEIYIDDGSLNIIAKISRGGMRDAIGYLDQISTIAEDKNIVEEKTQKYFGVIDRSFVYDVVKTIVAGDISLLMDQVNDMIMASADIGSILEEISEVFRCVQVLKAQNGKTHLIDLPDSEVSELKNISELLNMNQLIKLSKLFTNIEKKMEYSIHDRWIMEATLISCAASLRQNKTI